MLLGQDGTTTFAPPIPLLDNQHFTYSVMSGLSVLRSEYKYWGIFLTL